MKLIRGINPLTISMIKVSRGKRFGKSGVWYRVYKKKHPIRGLFLSEDWTDFWVPAEVRIISATGKALVVIECRSNARAEQLKQELEAELISAINVGN